MQIWKPIHDYPDYLISNYGNVVSKRRTVDRCGINNLTIKATVLKPIKNNVGYLTVCLYNGKKTKYFSIHRLVALHFIPNPHHKKMVNHVDGIKTNNIISNLEWCTAKENSIHANKLGLQTHAKGEARYNSKLKERDVLEIRKLFDSGEKTVAELSVIYKMSKGCIGGVVYRKSWKHI